MNELLRLDRQNIWHPFTPLLGADEPILIKSAQGVYLHTHDNKKIIDAVASWWVNLHGHSHPYIAKALSDQASTLEHVIFAGFTHEPAIKLSQNLLNILPDNQSKIFFSDNGSTAVEVALKIALQFWHNQGINKKNVVALRGAYHGDTFGAMSVGERSIFTNAFESYLFDVHFVDFPDEHHEDQSFNQFRELIDQKQIAAFIFEPLIQGAAGMRMYNAAVLDKMLAYANAHDVICIADEVFTGFGRTGKMFACNYLTNKPDIIALSKGLTGGTMPMGITSCSAHVISGFESDNLLKTFFHGHSFTANPLACAVANASFDLLMKKECQDSIQNISNHQMQFAERIRKHEKVKNIRSLGTILALELASEEESSYTNSLRKKILPYFLHRGIYLRPLGNVIYIVPPYVMTPDELGFIHGSIVDFLNEI